MDFRLLGAFTVSTAAGDEIVFARRRDRCLLALLLLEAGMAISVDRLMSLLWDEDPPAGARRAVHSHVSRIRNALGNAPDAVAPVSSGATYRMDVAPQTVDALRFRAVLDDAMLRHHSAVDRAAALRQALDMWRGPMMADIASDRLRHRVCADFEQRRLDGLEAWLGAELELGHHRDRVPDLVRACADHPDHEGLAALNLIALHRSGRTAAASEFFVGFRRSLVESTGIEPGARLIELHNQILRGQTVRWGTPSRRSAADLRPAFGATPPQSVKELVGRRDELALLQTIARGPGPRIVTIHGPGGVGKTTLAIWWSLSAADRFPDGVSYFDFHAVGPVSSLDAVADLALAAFGVTGPSAASGCQRYRHAVRGRRLLILDNVPDAAHGRALLPADPEVMVVTISRAALDGLAIHDGAIQLPVRTLALADAVDLLAAAAGAHASDERLRTLAELCDRLPLALRIVGCRLREHGPVGIEMLLNDLQPADRRLAALEIDGVDRGVRAVLEDSYGALAPPEARMLRLISTLPGTTVDVPAAACLADLPQPDVYRCLTSLTRSQLLVREASGRYRMHDLTRIFAQERATAELSRAERDAALRRVVDWYLDTTDAAYDLLSPRRAAFSPLDLTYPPAHPTRFANRNEAISWFDAQRQELAAMVRALRDRQWHKAAWRLAASLFPFYHQRRLWSDWTEVYLCALESAIRDGETLGLVRVYNGLGVAYKQLGRYQTAIRYYEEALAAAEQWGDPLIRGPIHSNLGGAYNTAGAVVPARRHLMAALALPGYGDDPRYAPLLLLNLGHLEFNARQFAVAGDHLRRALPLTESTADQHTAAYLHHGLGEIAFQEGLYEAAETHAAQALESARQLGDPLRQAYALDLLASIKAVRGDGSAGGLWSEAQRLSEGIGHALADDIREFLANPAAGLSERRFVVNKLP